MAELHPAASPPILDAPLRRIALDVVTGACVLAIAAAIALGIYIMANK